MRSGLEERKEISSKFDLSRVTLHVIMSQNDNIAQLHFLSIGFARLASHDPDSHVTTLATTSTRREAR